MPKTMLRLSGQGQKHFRSKVHFNSDLIGSKANGFSSQVCGLFLTLFTDLGSSKPADIPIAKTTKAAPGSQMLWKTAGFRFS